MKKIFFLVLILFCSKDSLSFENNKLQEKLSNIKTKILSLEQELIDSAKSQTGAKNQLYKIRVLLRLQKEEIKLYNTRLKTIENTVLELETRKDDLKLKVQRYQDFIRSSLREIHRTMRHVSSHSIEVEKKYYPKRKVLSHYIDFSLKELEAYQTDLDDSLVLEKKIQEEHEQLAYELHELSEQKSILELNKQIQMDLLQKKVSEKIKQLESYKTLRTTENQIEKMLTEFNARKELDQIAQTEKQALSLTKKGEFEKQKGKLSLPLRGDTVSGFGKTFDAQSGLYVFKKGLDIAPKEKNQKVFAIYTGKVVFSGELPNYGKVLILDHGGNYYSLIGKLGELYKKEGEIVKTGASIGIVDNSGNRIYFEIRSKNIAINPMQWISRIN
ncbi:MAG: peptidoglycan DD-metalloendopeptidase family protein [Deltaproteobacteria bacterium]|nr:peptidoglycan DD-metalloendopeptidase family protein [Deltaproteobacteria bacterium]